MTHPYHTLHNIEKSLLRMCYYISDYILYVPISFYNNIKALRYLCSPLLSNTTATYKMQKTLILYLACVIFIYSNRTYTYILIYKLSWCVYDMYTVGICQGPNCRERAAERASQAAESAGRKARRGEDCNAEREVTEGISGRTRAHQKKRGI